MIFPNEIWKYILEIKTYTFEDYIYNVRLAGCKSCDFIAYENNINRNKNCCGNYCDNCYDSYHPKCKVCEKYYKQCDRGFMNTWCDSCLEKYWRCFDCDGNFGDEDEGLYCESLKISLCQECVDNRREYLSEGCSSMEYKNGSWVVTKHCYVCGI